MKKNFVNIAYIIVDMHEMSTVGYIQQYNNEMRLLSNYIKNYIWKTIIRNLFSFITNEKTSRKTL